MSITLVASSDWLGFVISGIVAICFLAIAVLVNSRPVLYRLRHLAWISTVFGLSLVICIFFLLRLLGLAFSDVLAVLGIIVTFTLGFWGNVLVQKRHRVSAALVIPSRSPFNVELRREFRSCIAEKLAGIPVNVYDRYSNVDTEYEGLVNFVPELQSTELRRFDYIVVEPPSVETSDSDEVQQVLKRVVRRGVRVIFIENPPTNEGEFNGKVTSICSDSASGAESLCGYAKTLFPNGGRVFLVSGPLHFSNAQIRHKVFTEKLAKNFDVQQVALPGWSFDGAKAQTAQLIAGGVQLPDLIVAGNDTMALGVCEALREAKGLPNVPRVFGYDGIRLALIAIADKHNPFSATIRIPPSAYGSFAADMICREIRGLAGPRDAKHDRVIGIGPFSLITKLNSDRILDSL